LSSSLNKCKDPNSKLSGNDSDPKCVYKIYPTPSAGLTIVANVAIATGPALLGAPRSVCVKFVLYYARVDIRI